MTPDEIARLPYRPCVGVMLTNARGEVFVGQRIDNPGPAWQMPQGGIDPGESVEEAALRELREETGVTPDLVRLERESADWVTYDLPHELVPKIWKGRFRGQKQKWVLMRFLGTDDRIDIATEHPEFSTWRWIAPEALPGVIVPFKRQVYEEVLAQFAGALGR
ncbi:RNA pyrophosphohydrolase [Rhodosalinus sp.]|uniref:RNA pyrophosphohydrolase n=1 Tax=Rhodosalinus sp. TaxID=2047741 RepID=UPI00397940DB